MGAQATTFLETLLLSVSTEQKPPPDLQRDLFQRLGDTQGLRIKQAWLTLVVFGEKYFESDT